MAIEVLEPGLLTTVQDLGRHGYQRFSMPVSGAMDSYALVVGNTLLGNDPGGAGIECTFFGPSVKLHIDTWFALTGAASDAALDGVPVPMWRACFAKSGSTLSIGRSTDGLRTYLTLSGGIDIPPVMGSRSTYTLARVGGFEGRALRKGDILPLGTSAMPPGALPEDSVTPLPEGWEPEYHLTGRPLRVVLGPQDDHFTAGAIDVFFRSEYAIHNDSNRMGYRLSGPVLAHKHSADIISDATCLGAIQVPAHGQPIILMTDRQTTGGYPKMGCVISTDIPVLAQLPPGKAVRFERVTLEEAHKAFHERKSHLESLKRNLAGLARTRESRAQRYAITINGNRHLALVERL